MCNNYKSLYYLALLAAFIFMVPLFVSAHPGNTATDGCHYCRTNCDKWGVPWNQRHCHGGRPSTIINRSDEKSSSLPYWIGGAALVGGIIWWVSRRNR